MKLEMDTESQFTICCIVVCTVIITLIVSLFSYFSYRLDTITETVKSGADPISVACAVDGRCPISSAQPKIYHEEKQL